MGTRRSYHDNCGMAHALDLIGERWALLVIRELLFGPKRFGDLKQDLPGISTNMLTDRLTELEGHGVVRRAQLPPPAGTRVWELTEWGAGLEPAIRAIGRWGASSPFLPTDQHVSAATAVVSLRTNLDPVRAADADEHLALRLGDESFTVDVAAGAVHIARGPARAGDVVVSCAPGVLTGMLYGGLDPSAALAEGVLHLDGAVDRLRAFCACFALPEPAVLSGG